MTYEYYINLDERGEFEADVRDADGKTVFELNADLFEDGWMKNKHDIFGLLGYLEEMDIVPDGSRLELAN
jgi:hypothetical protein